MAKSLGWYLPEQMVLKVTLMDTNPPIWRRVEVHSGFTLHELHYVIQAVFSWENSHLYHFLVTPDGKLTQTAMREAVFFSKNPPDPFFDEENKDNPADQVMIGRIFTDQVKQIVYEYDFGDSWNHLVELEKRTKGGDQYAIPVCLAGENAAPVDDMGGIWGFYDAVAAIKDKSAEGHKDAVMVLGKKFDPAVFDLAQANKRLKATFKPVPKKRPKAK
jgi:hypothetical protein